MLSIAPLSPISNTIIPRFVKSTTTTIYPVYQRIDTTFKCPTRLPREK
jgi:hypothetical protein